MTKSNRKEEFTKRANIRIPNEVWQYFKDKSDRTGVSMSALMYLALEEYITNKNMMESMPTLLDKVTALEQKIEKQE